MPNNFPVLHMAPQKLRTGHHYIMALEEYSGTQGKARLEVLSQSIVSNVESVGGMDDQTLLFYFLLHHSKSRVPLDTYSRCSANIPWHQARGRFHCQYLFVEVETIWTNDWFEQMCTLDDFGQPPVQRSALVTKPFIRQS
jgi:hypothetical protein